ncbi:MULTISPECIES: class I mannose-6-phosphate isomerase [Staphylococcus]|uniref:class I mannose-6-phosphate isomerase n=1 Tax=Staphylococcus TaxID=1279 RepID=UPI000A7071DA|nr:MULTISPECIES: PRD domain-containing protein [Staphylococcus]PYE10086.1 mannose-6-phosphate isomerase class I [Staphylococcus sp. AtHG25]QXN78019.1 PRD domain-containing protein [Staphylococcus haemolyticus]WEB18437.1 PRD domain-containing protein [Staphylococcus haemolyticus]
MIKSLPFSRTYLRIVKKVYLNNPLAGNIKKLYPFIFNILFEVIESLSEESGIMILETQQSSDTTYRIYDYDRKDKDGNTRDLHLEQSKDVIDISNQDPNTEPIEKHRNGQKFTQFVSNEFFTVEKWDIQGVLDYEKPHDYCLITVIEGNGKINIDGENFEIEKGKHFILTTEDNEIKFEGELSIIVSYSSVE